MALNSEEKEAAKAAKEAEKEAAKAAPTSIEAEDIEVGDPQVLRPVELPLVVKPTDGGAWSNDNQAEYAATLNGYAYKNPAKWAKKKSKLIANLVAIGKDPSLLFPIKGQIEGQENQKLEFKNKLMQQ